MAESTPETPSERSLPPRRTPLREAAAAPASRPSLNGLPTYARRLAANPRAAARDAGVAQRKSIQEIIELGPGSIVKFDKTCDEPLELCIGDRPIAHGEVVKVGDKFGLRISGLVK